MYLIGGIFALFFYALFLGIVAIVWSIGAIITGISILIVAIWDYFHQENERNSKSDEY